MHARINLLLLLFVTGAEGQSLLSPSASRATNRVLDEGVLGDRLACRIEPKGPFLDFGFRFESGYLVHCPVKIFGGEASEIYDLIRVTPDGGQPVILGQRSAIPAIPPEIKARVDIGKVKSEIEYSGVFAAGEGRYSVEVVVGDSKDRFIEKRWHIDVQRHHEERSAEVALPPDTVAPMSPHPWDGTFSPSRTNLRVTILLDAAPINPYALKLRAWDRAFLLDSLSSVLTKIHCNSVRLVAFNLDQQRELFRDDRFDKQGWMKLARDLRDLELGTVSFNILQNRQGWSDLLLQILNAEMTSPEPSDAVILLGPATRVSARIPSNMLPVRKASKPEFFYVDYYPYWLRGTEFPDTLARLTHDLGGSLLKIHSPGELAQAIKEIQTRLEAR